MKLNLLKLYNISSSFRYKIYNGFILPTLSSFNNLCLTYSIRIFLFSNNFQFIYLALYNLPFFVYIKKFSKFSYNLYVESLENLHMVYLILQKFESVFIECFFLFNNFISAFFYINIQNFFTRQIFFKNIPLYLINTFLNMKTFNYFCGIFFLYRSINNLMLFKNKNANNKSIS